jgi:hypothetical protein
LDGHLLTGGIAAIIFPISSADTCFDFDEAPTAVRQEIKMTAANNLDCFIVISLVIELLT